MKLVFIVGCGNAEVLDGEMDMGAGIGGDTDAVAGGSCGELIPALLELGLEAPGVMIGGLGIPFALLGPMYEGRTIGVGWAGRFWAGGFLAPSVVLPILDRKFLRASIIPSSISLEFGKTGAWLLPNTLLIADCTITSALSVFFFRPSTILVLKTSIALLSASLSGF